MSLYSPNSMMPLKRNTVQGAGRVEKLLAFQIGFKAGPSKYFYCYFSFDNNNEIYLLARAVNQSHVNMFQIKLNKTDSKSALDIKLLTVSEDYYFAFLFASLPAF